MTSGPHAYNKMNSQAITENHTAILQSITKRHAGELAGTNLFELYTYAQAFLNTGGAPGKGFTATKNNDNTVTMLSNSSGFYVQLTKVTQAKVLLCVGRKYAIEVDNPAISSTSTATF